MELRRAHIHGRSREKHGCVDGAYQRVSFTAIPSRISTAMREGVGTLSAPKPMPSTSSTLRAAVRGARLRWEASLQPTQSYGQRIIRLLGLAGETEGLQLLRLVPVCDEVEEGLRAAGVLNELELPVRDGAPLLIG